MTFFSSPTSLNRCTLNQLKHRACKTEVAGWLKRDRDHLICSRDGQEVFKKEQSGPIMQWCIISHKEEVDVMGREGDRPEGKFCQLHSLLLSWLKTELCRVHYILLVSKREGKYPDPLFHFIYNLQLHSLVLDSCLIKFIGYQALNQEVKRA